MRSVVFRPYWDVPRSITVEEMLPKIQQDPGYLAAQHLEIVEGDGPAVLPDTPESVARLATGTARLRQRPGPDNPLGKIKFLFPNRHSVYLHDTPSQENFRKSRRDFSHGCIRVEDPVGLATWVLHDSPEWSRAAIEAELEGEGELRVPLRDSILVVVLYATVSVRSDGRVFFFDDIYGHDEQLARALAAGEPYRR
jgi:murein L,D-transpeptidase YcbB/YkuD